MSQASVIVHSEPKVLAQATAARLIVRLLDAQATRGAAAVVLTGGRIAAQVYTAVRESPASDAVDWSRVDFWWGDERFLPTGDPERNETQARTAFLDLLKVAPATLTSAAPYALASRARHGATRAQARAASPGA